MRDKFYYCIWVRTRQYHKRDPLTYYYHAQLALGSIVSIELKDKATVGIVMANASAPSFETKPIIAVTHLPPLPQATLELAMWIREYYPAPLGTITGLFIPKTITETSITKPTTLVQKTTSLATPLPLTHDQENALAQINRPDTYILHGKTGSGKTRVYLELSKRVLETGKSVIVLIPEIGLTSHIADVFCKMFGDQVTVTHSRQTTKVRLAQWLKIQNSVDPRIIIGPRSALFSPVKKLGLIVVDESHDTSYKQEQLPRYNAVRVAAKMRNIHNAYCVLGSATPAITDYYTAEVKEKTIVRMSNLATKSDFKKTYTVVDMANKELFNRSPHLSLPLIKAIETSLSKEEQVLLYLNRRGTARITACENCGWKAMCPHCDIPLTYHGDHHMLRCHVCTYHQQPPFTCPSCGNPSVSFRSFGTKAIVDEVNKLFPGARVIRFDADNTMAERLESNLESVQSNSVDIIVGTQMIAKGLDLPHLSTLGVILADTSLFTPDFTAQERTYQLINQVIGRIGRGHIVGTAIIQTYQPKSQLIRSAIEGRWKSFYDEEIDLRKRYFYPPFCHILKLTVSRKSESGAQRAAEALARTISNQQFSGEIVGPSPAFHYKTAGSYRWQIVVKARQRQFLVSLAESTPPNGWSYDLDPSDLL